MRIGQEEAGEEEKEEEKPEKENLKTRREKEPSTEEIERKGAAEEKIFEGREVVFERKIQKKPSVA